jgi:hypothetical protein
MATEQKNERAEPIPDERWVFGGRPMAVATAITFFTSTILPMVAGLSKNTAAFPKWWGVLDVGIAFVLGFLVIVVIALTQGRVNRQAEEASYRAYRVLTHGIFVKLVEFFLLNNYPKSPHASLSLQSRRYQNRAHANRINPR